MTEVLIALCNIAVIIGVVTLAWCFFKALALSDGGERR